MAWLHKEDKKLIGVLLSPSWLSGLLAVVIGLTISLGTLLAFSFNSSSVQQQLISWQQDQPAKPLHTGALVSTEKPTIKNSWPLFLVWTIIGLAVYSVAAALIHSISNAEKLHESLGYVNAQRDKMIRLTELQIGMRALGAAALGISISIFIKTVVPYSITAAHASAAEVLSVTGFLYALVSFAVIVICWHIVTIFTRLSFGRVRLFS
jgi:hypothetical protein